MIKKKKKRNVTNPITMETQEIFLCCFKSFETFGTILLPIRFWFIYCFHSSFIQFLSKYFFFEMIFFNHADMFTVLIATFSFSPCLYTNCRMQSGIILVFTSVLCG